MGDEIQDPQRKRLPGAVAWGGVLSGLAIHRSDPDATDRGQQKRDQRAARHRAGREPHGGAGGSGVDCCAVCVFCSAFRSRASGRRGWAVRRVSRLWQDSIPTCRRGWAKCIRNIATPYAALIVHAAVSLLLIVMNFAGAGRAGDVSEDVVAGGGAAIGAISLHVWRVAENCIGPGRRPGTLQQDDAGLSWYQRTGHDDSRHRAGIFSGAADHFAVVLRNLDVRRDAVLRWPGGVLLLCVWTAQRRWRSRRKQQIELRARTEMPAGVSSGGDRGRAHLSALHQWRVDGEQVAEDFSGDSIPQPRKSSPRCPTEMPRT